MCGKRPANAMAEIEQPSEFKPLNVHLLECYNPSGGVELASHL